MKRILVFILLSIVLYSPANASNRAQSIEFLLSQVRTSTTSLANGKVYFYKAGTSTPQSIWIDRTKNTLAANPYTLDANGTAQLYGDGVYRVVIKDSGGTTRYDRDNLKFTDGDTNTVTFDSLTEAITLIGSEKTTIRVSSDITLTDSLNIPSNIELVSENKAIITIPTGKTLTFSSPPTFPKGRQIFAGGGTVLGLIESWPEMFADNTSPGTTDMKGAFDKALASFNGKRGELKITGLYAVTGSIHVPSYAQIIGITPDYTLANEDMSSTKGSVIVVPSSALSTMAGKAILDVSNTNYVTIDHVGLRATGDPLSNTVIGISDTAGGAGVPGAHELTVKDNYFQWFGGPVMKFKGNVIAIDHNRGNNQGSHFIWFYRDTADTAAIASDFMITRNESGAHQSYNSESTGTTREGSAIRIENGGNGLIEANHLYNHKYGIELLGGSISAYIRVLGNRLEKHGSAGMLLSGLARGIIVANNELFNNGYMTDGYKTGIKLVSAQRCSLLGNWIFNEDAYPGGTNTEFGIYVDGGSGDIKIADNTAYGMRKNSYRVTNSNNIDLTNNLSHSSQEEGFNIIANVNGVNGNSINDVLLFSNQVFSSGQAANNTYDGIVVSAGTGTTINNLVIDHNKVRHEGGATKARYGIRINTALVYGTTVKDNDLVGSGNTAALSDIGTSTAKSGNRLASGVLFGKATLSAGHTTVLNSEIQAGDNIIVTPATNSGEIVATTNNIVPGVSFDISSTAGTNDVVFYQIIH